MTVKEFLKTQPTNRHGNLLKPEESLIEFAKYHVEKALQKSYKNARIDINGNKVIGTGFRNKEGEFLSISIDKHSITNAYPTNLIK